MTAPTTTRAVSLIADLEHRARYMRQPEVAGFRIGDLAEDIACEIDRAVAMLSAAPAGAGWQDISTAPKDVDILLSDGTHVSQGGWVTDLDHGADYEGQLGAAGWWHLDGDTPTHWMPLPQPPGDSKP